MHPQLAQILHELRQHFIMLYGSQLERLMVFGSQARKDADAGSDIDVMVVLLGKVDAWLEIERTGEFVANLCLAYGVVISELLTKSVKLPDKEKFLSPLRRLSQMKI